MKQKKQNRILAALLAVAMMFQMLPMMAFAAEDKPLEKGQAKIGETVYDSVLEAVKDAPADGSTTTITLGEGNYTLYDTNVTAGKNLTFVGQGAGLTTWNIGYPSSDQGNQNNADFSFKDSKTITFQNLTLKAGDEYNYQGFAHTDTTVVENCVVEGMTVYWGYNSATFKDTTFKPGGYKYALWTYCSKDTIFDHCKFECEGKAIYVYNEGNPLIKIHFKDCKVTNSGVKSALNINDSFANFKIYISGDNDVDAKRDTYTCSRVYGFNDNSQNHSKTEVYIGEGVNAELVWQNGQMVTHKHSDGEKDKKLTKTYDTEWKKAGSHYECDVTTKCDYCHYTTKGVETGYELAYNLNGGVAAEGENYDKKIVAENETVNLAAAPAREGFYFLGWEDENGNRYDAAADIKLSTNTKLTAQWGDVPPVVPDTPDGGGKEVATVIVAAGAAVLGYYVGTGLLMDCYRLPYWPKTAASWL